jgi:ADP-ribose pyrophosphatase
MAESMQIFVAEGLIAGEAHPEEDETIDFRLIELEEILSWVDKGKILDGKTLIGIMLYARLIGVRS